MSAVTSPPKMICESCSIVGKTVEMIHVTVDAEGNACAPFWACDHCDNTIDDEPLDFTDSTPE